MPLHRVDINKDETTAGAFLKSKMDASLIKTMLGCSGIIHFTRGGERSEVTDEGHTLHRDDFVFVADQCPTGQAQTVATPDIPRDFAFVIPGDSFGTNARNFMNRRPSTEAITGVDTLDAILQAISGGARISAPIKDIVIVSHANTGGFLFFNLDGRDGDGQIDYAELEGYAGRTSKPEITKRILRDGANVHIRGCNIGNAQPFLDKLKEAIGSHVTVTAPKFFDQFGNFSRGTTITRYECMLYLFGVFSQAALNRTEVIARLKAKAPSSFRNFDGKPVPDEWETWVPRNVGVSSETAHPCKNPIDSEMVVNREFKHRHRTGLYSYTIDLEEAPPNAHAERVAILKTVLKQDPLMSASHAFPQYKWFGYESFDAFVDGLHWDFAWNGRRKELGCTASRHEYEVRIPITDAGNNLFVNVLPDAGTRKFSRTDLVETDGRFFGRA
jgi:hypothetical protein